MTRGIIANSRIVINLITYFFIVSSVLRGMLSLNATIYCKDYGIQSDTDPLANIIKFELFQHAPYIESRI